MRLDKINSQNKSNVEKRKQKNRQKVRMKYTKKNSWSFTICLIMIALNLRIVNDAICL
jgi:hypothetical protein